MDPNKTHVSLLESLLQDLIGEIVARVGADSPQDYVNFILSCKELAASAPDKRMRKRLNLAPLVKRPLASSSYQKLMDKWLANNNPYAHYIEGILEYFVHNDKFTGLYHFSVAADAGHKEAVYLYAIILLCKGLTNSGQHYLSQLKWEEDTTMVDKCWENIKTSLHGIRVLRKRLYVTSLRQMKPRDACHLYDMNNSCAKCFYYKQMFKFIYMI
ncbi:unnamed protein product [Arabis nemorensis]|uniref:At2g35280-like TPR domain-containing protein n=1 Tax=Arabis nemorensis TaxID=586526 RepID=A0A565CN72_9BRAS|nr:unnamed protein product [Arabis nemorensis]